MNLIRNEPVLIANLIKAVVILAVSFGLPLSGDQQAALIGVTVAVIAVGGVVRSQVTPVAKVERLAGEIGGNAVKLANRITGGNDGT